MERQRAYERRQRQEELLAEATKNILAGDFPNAENYAPLIIFSDGSFKPVNWKIDPKVAEQVDQNSRNCPQGHFSGYQTSQQCGLSTLQIPPQVLKDLIQSEYERLSRQSWISLETLHFVLDLAGLTPGVGAIPDFGNAVLYALEGNTLAGMVSLVGMIPIVGDAAVIGKIGTKVVPNAETIAVKLSDEAASAASGSA